MDKNIRSMNIRGNTMVKIIERNADDLKKVTDKQNKILSEMTYEFIEDNKAKNKIEYDSRYRSSEK